MAANKKIVYVKLDSRSKAQAERRKQQAPRSEAQAISHKLLDKPSLIKFIG